MSPSTMPSPDSPTADAARPLARRLHSTRLLARRTMLAAALGAAGGVPALARSIPASPEVAAGARQWAVFRQRFVSADGRVVDTGNGGVSHSEGQGIAMLSAAHFAGQAEFDLIHGWTTQNLRRPHDALHSWRFRPGAAVPVDDPNNATDGDLLIALALFMAADRWGDRDYRLAGMAIGRAVMTSLVQQTAGGVVLLPGLTGFEKRTGVVLNPSYYMFPAIRRLAVELPDPLWADLWADGLTLVRAARFGRWGLTPDWLTLSRDGDLSVAGGWPARCSFDAVRLPLYMCWAGLVGEPAVTSAHAFWSRNGAAAPAWVDLRTDAVAPFALTSGMEAIRRFVGASVDLRSAPDLPGVAQATDYYSAALIMLTHCAAFACHGGAPGGCTASEA